LFSGDNNPLGRRDQRDRLAADQRDRHHDGQGNASNAGRSRHERATGYHPEGDGRDHFVARHVRRPVRHAMPWLLGRIGLVGVDLGIDDCHWTLQQDRLDTMV
jgi:hypothetical protein